LERRGSPGTYGSEVWWWRRDVTALSADEQPEDKSREPDGPLQDPDDPERGEQSCGERNDYDGSCDQ